MWLLIGLVCARIAGSQLRAFYFFVQWLKIFGNLFFIWGIKGYAEDCTTDAIVLARNILLSQEFQNMESSTIVCVVDNLAKRGTVGLLMVLDAQMPKSSS